MTTQEKLKALGFFDNNNDWMVLVFNVKKCDISLNFNHKHNVGFIENITYGKRIRINEFTQLLKWHNFYEKQAKRIARRNEGRDGSETQNQFHQAH